MADVIPKGKFEPGAAAVASQVAGAFGAREVGNIVSAVAAWKTFTGLIPRIGLGLGVVIPLLQKGYSAIKQQREELHKLGREFGVTLVGLQGYSKNMEVLSRHTLLSNKELRNLGTSLVLTTGFIDKGLKVTNDYIYALGKLFPNATQEAVKSLAQLSNQMPIAIDWLDKGNVGFSELFRILKGAGPEAANLADQLARFKKGEFGVGPTDVSNLLKFQGTLKGIAKEWSNVWDNSSKYFAGLNQDFNKLPPGLKAGMAGQMAAAATTLTGVIEAKYVAAKERERLGLETVKQYGGTEEDYRLSQGGLEVEKELTQLAHERLELDSRIAAFNKEFEKSGLKQVLDYNKFVARSEYQLSLLGQQKLQNQALVEEADALYKPIQEIGAIKLQHVQYTKSEADELWSQVEAYEQKVIKEGKSLAILKEDNEYQGLRTKAIQKSVEVTKEESYIRRSYMEKMLQMALGLKQGTYTMPSTLSERGTKGGGYSPFMPLERGPGGKSWGSYAEQAGPTRPGEVRPKTFTERPTTGPYEPFYQRLFGGGAGFRSPVEADIEDQLNEQKKMSGSLASIDGKMGGTPGTPGTTATPVAASWYEAPTAGRMRTEEEKTFSSETIKELSTAIGEEFRRALREEAVPLTNP